MKFAQYNGFIPCEFPAAAISAAASAKDGGVGDAAFAAATRRSARRSLADRAYSDTACDKAAMFLEDGLHYREMVEWGDSDERSRRVYSFAYGRAWRSFYAVVLNLPWPSGDSSHWGWFKVHRHTQMQRPADWGLNVSRVR